MRTLIMCICVADMHNRDCPDWAPPDVPGTRQFPIRRAAAEGRALGHYEDLWQDHHIAPWFDTHWRIAPPMLPFSAISQNQPSVEFCRTKSFQALDSVLDPPRPATTYQKKTQSLPGLRAFSTAWPGQPPSCRLQAPAHPLFAYARIPPRAHHRSRRRPSASVAAKRFLDEPMREDRFLARAARATARHSFPTRVEPPTALAPQSNYPARFQTRRSRSARYRPCRQSALMR